VLARVGDINPSNRAVPDTVGTGVVAEDIGKLLPVIAGSGVVLNVRSVLLKGSTGDTEATVVVIAGAEPSWDGSKTFGMVALAEVSAAKGMSMLLKVVVETIPEVVNVTVSVPSEVTRLDNGPAVSMLLTNGSMSKPGLIAKIMPISQ
jgi:hypothetical protein